MHIMSPSDKISKSPYCKSVSHITEFIPSSTTILLSYPQPKRIKRNFTATKYTVIVTSFCVYALLKRSVSQIPVARIFLYLIRKADAIQY
jgi:hypothetical protein